MGRCHPASTAPSGELSSRSCSRAESPFCREGYCVRHCVNSAGNSGRSCGERCRRYHQNSGSPGDAVRARGGAYAIRNLLDVCPEVRRSVASARLRELAAEALGASARCSGVWPLVYKGQRPTRPAARWLPGTDACSTDPPGRLRSGQWPFAGDSGFSPAGTSHQRAS